MCFLYTLLGIFLFLVLILCIPFDLAFDCNTKSSPRIALHLYWLLGIIKYKLIPRRERAQSKPEAAAAKPVKKSPFNLNTLVNILRTRGLVKRVIRLLRGILKSVGIKRLKARFSIGLEDPVEYGYFFSLCVPVNYILARTHHDIQLEPVYEGQYICDVDAAGVIRIIPIRLAGILLAFILSIPVMKVLGIIIRSKWKQNRSK